MAQVAARPPEEVGLPVAREGRQQRLSDDKRVRTLAGVLPMVEAPLAGDELSDRHVFHTFIGCGISLEIVLMSTLSWLTFDDNIAL